MNIIEVKNISKDFIILHEKKNTSYEYLFKKKSNYSKLNVLKNISFNLNEKESLGIIGKNGSGKTTLLKIIAGIIKPNSGSIDIYGSLLPFIELGICFENELTGKENIYLYGSLLGLQKKKIDKGYKEIIRFADIDNFIDTKLKNYSKGMILRLAFSVAIHIEANIILIDEILAVGDESFRKKCLNKMKELKQQGRSFILVSHSLPEIENFCDRCIVLDKGEIKYNGKTSSAIELYLTMIEKDKKTIKLGKRLEKRYNKLTKEEGMFKKKKKDELEINNKRLDEEVKRRYKKLEIDENGFSEYKKKMFNQIARKDEELKKKYDELEINNKRLDEEVKRRYKKLDDSEKEFETMANKRLKAIISNEKKIKKLHEEVLKKVYIYKALLKKNKIKTKKIGGIKIKDVKFYNKNKKEKNIFSNTEKITVEIAYEALKKIKKPIVGICLFNKEGLLLSWFNNIISDYKINELKNKGKIYCTFEPKPLPAGEYLISVDIQNKDYQYHDYIDRGFSLKIIEKEKLKHGLVNIESEWMKK